MRFWDGRETQGTGRLCREGSAAAIAALLCAHPRRAAQLLLRSEIALHLRPVWHDLAIGRRTAGSRELDMLRLSLAVLEQALPGLIGPCRICDEAGQSRPARLSGADPMGGRL
jgi:hypothetical protein